MRKLVYMKPFVEPLLSDFSPPGKPHHPIAPSDFSRLNLAHEPPADLVWLYEVYGEGTFNVAVGDPIRLMMPTKSCVSALRQYWANMRAIMAEGLLDKDLFTAGPAWFTGENEPEAIFWGSSMNGLNLMSIWISDSIRWATVIFDTPPGNCVCVFRSPAQVLHDAVLGAGFLSSLFPEAQRPFHFERVQPDEEGENDFQDKLGPGLSGQAMFTAEEIQRLVDQSLSSIPRLPPDFDAGKGPGDK